MIQNREQHLLKNLNNFGKTYQKQIDNIIQITPRTDQVFKFTISLKNTERISIAQVKDNVR